MSESFGYRAIDIAKWFVNATDRESGDDITHLKVQKLVYYAQGWSLANFGKCLFDEDLQAWAHGPVAPSVWDYFKIYKWDSIPPQKTSKKFEGSVLRLLMAISEKYGIYTAKALEKRTHTETPWARARGNLPPEAICSNVIRKSDMTSFFNAIKNARAA